MVETERQKLDRRWGELKTIRSGLEPDWRTVCDNIYPWRQRWQATDLNRGYSINRQIIKNSTPTECCEKACAGMMAGITSKARRWIRLTTSDERLNKTHAVKEYLRACEDVLWSEWARSNLYEELASGIYPDIMQIGNAALFLDEGDTSVFQFEALAIGEYWIDINKCGRVNTAFRERPMTAEQLREEFGEAKISEQAKTAIKNGQLGQVFTVVHALYPNPNYDPNSPNPLKLRTASRWWEAGKTEGFLRESGYHEFPLLVGRWGPRPGEVYGRGPGWRALPDCRSLQLHQEQLMKLIDKTVDPPMRGSGIEGRASLLPADLTIIGRGAGGVYEPAVTIPPAAITAAQMAIEKDEQHIKDAFYVKLWQTFIDDERNQRPTAYEVQIIRQEAMLQLGPLLENLDSGILGPLTERSFAILARRGKLPPAPDELVELQLQDPTNEEGLIHVDFISILHAAQKATGITAVVSMIGQLSQLSQAMPSILDKIDVDAFVDELADMYGVRPEIIYSADEVEKLRAEKARHAQAQEEGQAMLAATQGAKNLSASDPQKIAEIAGMLSPAAAAQGGLQ